jgi:predicted metal-dependent hydrolase
MDLKKGYFPMEKGRQGDNDCTQPPSPQLLQGIEEFNSGAFFASHETLEDIWIGEKHPARRLYQGILQVAAALLHLERGNYRGAVTLLDKGALNLKPFTPLCQQVDVAGLLREIGRLREELDILGPERFRELDRGLLPRVRFQGVDPPCQGRRAF